MIFGHGTQKTFFPWNLKILRLLTELGGVLIDWQAFCFVLQHTDLACAEGETVTIETTENQTGEGLVMAEDELNDSDSM